MRSPLYLQLITVITLITHMNVFPQTFSRHTAFLLHLGGVLCSSHQHQKMCSLKGKTCKLLKMIEMVA